MHKTSYYIVNGITLFRIIAFPVLILLVIMGRVDIFRWLLATCFFTDLIDGFLARRYKVSSISGSRLDSIGDDLTVIAGVVGIFVFKFWFIKSELFTIGIMLSLFVIQVVMALIRYHKITSFHTYLAKLAALLQGIFLITSFFVEDPLMILFYAAAIVTVIELIEEIILVLILPGWKANVRGLYWVMKEDQTTRL